MPVALGILCCPGKDECCVRMDALEQPSRDTCTSLCVASGPFRHPASQDTRTSLCVAGMRRSGRLTHPRDNMRDRTLFLHLSIAGLFNTMNSASRVR